MIGIFDRRGMGRFGARLPVLKLGKGVKTWRLRYDERLLNMVTSTMPTMIWSER